MPDLLDLPAQEEESKKELADKLKIFLNSECKALIDKALIDGTAVVVEFSALQKFGKVGTELCAALLETPFLFFAAAKEATREYADKLPLRICNLPESQQVNVRDLRAKHLNRFISVEGTIRRSSEVRPEVMEMTWECSACGALIVKERIGNFIGKPFQCSNPNCGSRFGFREKEKTMIDVRAITIEEPFEMTEGDRPSQVSILLMEDLTTPELRRLTDPGNRIKVCGVLREIPRASKETNVKMDIYMHANHVQPTDIGWERIEITEEDEKEIIKMAVDPNIYKKLVNSLAPSIYGMDEIKESIILQLFGGVPTKMKDKTNIRGNIHILLIGDPSAGKSQLLKLAPQITPRGKYVSGKGVSSAGLTATVVKDEQFMGGWVLEAGAIVLANKGLLSIDEFDKMAPEDQVAMHEALEQGCYDGGTELVLEDGTRTTMAQLVDPYLSTETGDDQRKDISASNVHLFSSDFRQIRPSKIKAVRKHKEKLLYKLSLPTGHQLSITPHHPVLTLRDGAVVPVEAQKLRPGDVVPVPLRLSFHGTSYQLPKGTVPSDHKHKPLSFPASTSPALCEWLGLLVAEGNAEVNRGVKNGVCFSNSDPILLGRFAALTERLFSVTPFTQKGNGSCWFLRVISRPLYEFVSSLEPRLFSRSWDKALPAWINTIPSSEAAALLRGLFDGEGSVNERYGTVSFTSTSRTLAVQVQQQLLRFGIFSGLYPDRSMKGKRKHTAYKVQFSGKDNISRFAEFVGFAGSRQARLERLLLKPTVSSRWNHLPGIVPFIEETRKALLLSYDKIAGHEMTGARKRNSVTKDLAARILSCFEQRLEQAASLRSRLEGAMTVPAFRQLQEEAGISRSVIARALGLPPQTVWYWLEVKKDPETLRKAAEQLKKMCADMLAQKEQVERLRLLTEAPFEWVPVSAIETVASDQWVYDVEMNPTGVFIGNGILCHNSVSIAKASIVATLPAQTSVLAGGNPKFGRFDQYKSIADQITVPDTLLSRFDLKFALKDVPDEKADRRLVEHMLKARESEAFSTPEIDPTLIKKFIAYTKTNCSPTLTKETGDTLKDFYLKMRKMSEGGNMPVAITLRQFEALIRLAQASAKVQLSQKVRKEDALRAIRLMEYSMKQLGYDAASGTFDVDKLEGSISHSERTKIQILFDIIAGLSKDKKAVPVKDIEAAAAEQKIDKHDVDVLLEKMKREGTLFEPSVGHIQKV